MKYEFVPFVTIISALYGCGTAPARTEVVTVEVPVYAPLPSELTEPVPEPQVEITDWDSVVQFAEELRAAFRLANEKLKKIRETEKPATAGGG